MIDRVSASLSFYDMTMVFEAVVALVFAAATYFQARHRYPYLWNINMKMLVAVGAFLCVSDVLYLIVYIRYPHSYFWVGFFELVKDFCRNGRGVLRGYGSRANTHRDRVATRSWNSRRFRVCSPWSSGFSLCCRPWLR